MANETTYGDKITVDAAVEAAIVPMFTSAVIMPSLIAPFNLGMSNTRAKKLPKSGTVTAAVVAEAAAGTPQVLTDTSVTLTLQKVMVFIKPTIEDLKFADADNPSRLASISAQAIAKKFEQDCLALATGFSASKDAGAAMTVAAVLEAAFNVKSGDIPTTMLDAILSHKQSFQLADDIRTQTGAFYGNPNFDPKQSAGVTNVPGFLGSFLGLNWYETGNNTTDLGDDVGLVTARQYAIAALYAEGLAPSVETTSSEHEEFTSSNTIYRTLAWYQVGEYVDAAGSQVRSDS